MLILNEIVSIIDYMIALKQKTIPYGFWQIKENCRQESLKYDTITEFMNSNRGAHKSATNNGWIREFFQHKNDNKRNNYLLSKKEQCRLEALKYSARGDFQKESPNEYLIAWKNDWLDELCAHISETRKPNRYWENKKHCAVEALKYDSIKKFQEGCSGAYKVAVKNSWIEELCTHMIRKSKRRGHWNNKELCYAEALKYDSRAEFKSKSSRAYQVAVKNEWIDEICSHMPIDHTTSVQERILFNIIKEIYPSAKKLRDRNIKIESKPYIYGFDIDIFIPELSLVIEFDGKWYHSYECMRSHKDKKKWTDEDILNYHEIKDGYFLSKGIKILHINESDWISNKETCIQKCFEFLESNKNV